MASTSLRAALKTGKASARLQHPYAHYSSSGALSCRLCPGVPVKHEALFASHVASKGHRVQALKAEQAEADRKRAREESEAARDAKRARTDEADNAGEEEADPNALPADFFADPSQAPVPAPKSRSPSPAAVAPAEEEEDEDWLAFERDVIQPVEATAEREVPSIEDARFTITAAPVAYNVAGELDAPPEVEEEETVEETPEERQERLLREEAEEMMSRLEECVRMAVVATSDRPTLVAG